MKNCLRVLQVCTLFIICVFALPCIAETALEHDHKFQTALRDEAARVPSFRMPLGSHLSWESSRYPERRLWSRYVFDVLNQYIDILSSAKDIELFCSNYRTLNRSQKILTWGQIFVGISKFESNWNPLEQTLEDQGSDPYTEKPVLSEGLLQLSYQDIETSPYCNFSWDQDKVLSSQNQNRTILNPYRNLYCGVRVMSDLVRVNKKIIVSEGGYWSTLQSGSPHENIDQIIAYAKKLTFCR